MSAQSAHRYDGGIGFLMLFGDLAVAVRVSDEALDDRAQTHGRTDRLEIFHEHFMQIKKIALFKFASHLIESDGSVLIKTRDLNA